MGHEGNRTTQWHETGKIEEAGGLSSFIKKYEPGSYEIKNELSWLLSTMIGACNKFRVPKVKDSSIDKGFIKMEFIENSNGKPLEEVVDFLVECAAELHSLLKTDKPQLRTPVNAPEYKPFLQNYTQKRVDSLRGTEFELPREVEQWIVKRIVKLKTKFFSIVHRDMRARHLLFQDNEKPVLIDWEFSNISAPAQDLAKIIYDATTHGMSIEEAQKRVLDLYAHLTKQSSDELRAKTNAFLPIIPLERDMSLISRKPTGYQDEILKDMLFIRTLYEEEK